MKSILKILFLFLALTFAVSCGSKKIINQTSVKENTSVYKTDSIKISERNRAIIDSLKLKIAQSATGDKKFDEAVNKSISEILEKLNTSKSSGDNSYSLVYDDVLKELRAVMKIGPTENLTTINNATVHTKEIIKDTREIPVKFIPKWVLVASIFGGCCAFGLLAFIIYKVSRFFKPKLPV